MDNIKKYDIWLINLNPTKGNEQSGIRPCLVIQNNLFYAFQGTTLIIPITSNIKKDYSVGVLLKNFKKYGLSEESFALTFQLRTVDKKRFIKKLGEIIDENIKNNIKESIINSVDLFDNFIE